MLFERRGRPGDFEPREREEEDFAEDAGDGADSCGEFPDIAGTLRAGRGGADAHLEALIPDVAWALQERDRKGPDSNTKQGHLIPVASFTLHGREGGNMPEIEPGGVSPALRAAGGGSSLPFVFKASHFTRGKDGAPSEITPALSADADRGDQDNLVCAPMTFDTTQITHPENRSQPRPGEPCHTLASAGHAPAVALAFNARQDPVTYGDLAVPLDADGYSQAVAIRWVVRRLTPTECERLQGLPDGHTLLKGETAFGPRYAECRNAMSVPVLEWILRRLGENMPPT